VTITERTVAWRHSTDDKFLELAVGGHLDLIVSGDADLLALNPFRDITIVPPAVIVQHCTLDPSSIQALNGKILDSRSRC
jgi:uncharacterized protein